MKLAVSSMITEIDKFSETTLGLSVVKLMEKSGEAVADTVRKRITAGASVIILAGKGNNGGDGYAAAVNLMDEYKVKVFDVFGQGQKYDAGKYFLSLFLEKGGVIEKYEPTAKINSEIKNASCVIDAVFGTGFTGEIPDTLRPLAITVREAVGTHKIAIDVPLGINADDGSVSSGFVISVEATVALSYIKPGIISYPARAYVGDIIYDSLGLPDEEISKKFSFKYQLLDSDFIRGVLPKRDNDSNKGSFGKLLMITGSKKYRGAAHLSAEAALRGGVGLVTFAGCSDLVGELSQKYPEIVYKEIPETDLLTDEDIAELCELSKKHTATLIGSGSDNTKGLLRLTLALLSTEGGTLILDADAINALAGIEKEGIAALKNAKRRVVITPHPLEFSRLTGDEVALVQLHRLEKAEALSDETGVLVVLKGAGTIVTDGESVYVNGSGSSALAKAGSGDVLAGLIGAMCAQRATEDIIAATISVYLHGLAGDSLAKEFSTYGVTPSDLPKKIAEEIARLERGEES